MELHAALPAQQQVPIRLTSLPDHVQAAIYTVLELDNRQRLASTCTLFRSLWLAVPLNGTKSDKYRQLDRKAGSLAESLFAQRFCTDIIDRPITPARRAEITAQQPAATGDSLPHCYATVHVGKVQERLWLPDKDWTTYLAKHVPKQLALRLRKLTDAAIFLSFTVEHYSPSLTSGQLLTLESVFEMAPRELENRSPSRWFFERRWRLVSSQGKVDSMFWRAQVSRSFFAADLFNKLNPHCRQFVEQLLCDNA